MGCISGARRSALGFTLEEAQVGPGDGVAQMLPARASGDTALGRAWSYHTQPMRGLMWARDKDFGACITTISHCNSVILSTNAGSH